MHIEFARSARSTIGIEWEVAIVDRATGELASIADRVLELLDARSEGGTHPTITSELLTNTVELVSGVHERVADAVADLEGQLAEVRAVIDELGDYELICSGSHPFSQWYDQGMTESPRYRKLIDRTRWWGRNSALGRQVRRRGNRPWIFSLKFWALPTSGRQPSALPRR